MANIDVQRKKKASPLPWILLILLIVAAVAYFLWSRNKTNDNGAIIDPTTTVQDSGAIRTDTLQR